MSEYINKSKLLESIEKYCLPKLVDYDITNHNNNNLQEIRYQAACDIYSGIVEQILGADDEKGNIITNNWIECSAKMPENGKEVIIVYYGSDLIVPQEGESLENAIKRIGVIPTVTIGTYYSKEGWYGADGYPLVMIPTYWQELPEVPECPEKIREYVKQSCAFARLMHGKDKKE